MSQRYSLIGTGIYPMCRAARIVGANLRTVRRWLKGSTRSTTQGAVSQPPLWPLQYWDDEELGDEYVLGFKDLMELRMVVQLVRRGVPLIDLRAVLSLARPRFGNYPLQSRHFLEAGQQLLAQALDHCGRSVPAALADVVQPSLFEDVEFDDDGNPVRWFPVPRQRVILIDPARRFGQPILSTCNVATDTLHHSHIAEHGNTERVARIWRVKPHEVMAAVQFEEGMAS